IGTILSKELCPEGETPAPGDVGLWWNTCAIDGSKYHTGTCNPPCADNDEDTYGAPGTNLALCTGSTELADCDDAEKDINLDAEEICDNKDNNCDDQIDETFNLQLDNSNCGSCGNVCAAEEFCSSGTCNPATLISYYSFDTNNADDQVSNNDGIVNGATWTKNGKMGGAFDFNGIDNYIDLNPHFDDANMVSVWFKTDSVGSNKRIVANGQGDLKWTLQISLGKLMISKDVTGAETLFTTTSDEFNDNTWHHVIADINNLKIWADGESMPGTKSQSTLSVRGNAGIGARFDIFFFKGLIDEVKIWKGVLTEDKICEEAGKNWVNKECITPPDLDNDGVADELEPEACKGVGTEGNVMSNGCLKGDMSAKGCVNSQDVAQFLAAYAKNYDVAGTCQNQDYSDLDGDFSGDQCVNSQDVAQFLAAYAKNYDYAGTCQEAN
ncbi:hypothetical protein HOC13_00545, partial [Candidatus Woesearchaeota archaeon]|nr:hypothetical protein [Candidatus Woesearchaeota archaeon]